VEHYEIRERLAADAAAATEESKRLTAEIGALDQAKEDAFAQAQFPIPGLSFGDGCFLFNGVPLAQASSAEQLRTSMAIAMASSPKLRVIRITDGSLLDDASMAEVERMAEENDFQVWVEQVGEKVGGIIIRDGKVAE